MIHTCILLTRASRAMMLAAALASMALVGCRPQANRSNHGGDSQPVTSTADSAADSVAVDGSESDGHSAADGTHGSKRGGEVAATDQSDGSAAADDADGGRLAADGNSSNGGSADGQSDGSATDSADGGTAGATDGANAAVGVDAEDKFPPLEPPQGLILLAKGQTVWVDKKNKQIVMDGEICLTAGQLELLVSEAGMKTHEAVISVKAKPSTVHAGLLAVGARQGTPVKYEPEYAVATGDIIDVKVMWWDRDGKPHEARGQDFARNFRTKKKLEHEWVFAGSGMWKDESNGRVSYMADSAGDFICVSNFSSAMMDLPIESSADNDGLSYEAFTENIPPRGTKVRVILTPMSKASEHADDGSKRDTADDSGERPSGDATGEADEPATE